MSLGLLCAADEKIVRQTAFYGTKSCIGRYYTGKKLNNSNSAYALE
jgi:hypothetical protein